MSYSRSPMDCQAPLSMGFPRQKECSGLPFPSPGDLPNTWIQPGSPALQVDSLPTEGSIQCNLTKVLKFIRNVINHNNHE